MILSFVRRIAASLALAAFVLPASATSTGIDYTDQWWGGQSESGWGVNFIEQGTTIFATLFIYGQDNTPRWYVATLDVTSNSTPTFAGLLYSTTGPYFGAGTFDPTQVHAAAAGTMTVVFSDAYGGALNYIINGTQVNKSIVRQSFKANNMAGNYMGGLAATASSCTGSGVNGAVFMNGGIAVTQTGQNLSTAVTFYNGAGYLTVCTFSGVLGLQGVLGQVSGGAFSCTINVNGTATAGPKGTFNLDAITMTQSGFSGTFSGSDGSCALNGYLGGAKQPM
jgi:hypothetical protein